MYGEGFTFLIFSSHETNSETLSILDISEIANIECKAFGFGVCHDKSKKSVLMK